MCGQPLILTGLQFATRLSDALGLSDRPITQIQIMATVHGLALVEITELLEAGPHTAELLTVVRRYRLVEEPEGEGA